ncbi:hypothetical protein TNCV_3818821 [Trichonephila clavipes]|nr:hypothetical protein TNCV_3818821 [Trichonephila clavipes]
MANNQSVRRHLDAFTRGRIIGKLEEGRSVTSVAAEFGIAHSIVSRHWRQFQTTGTAIRGFSSGRPRRTTPADDRLSSDSHRILIWRERGSRNHPSNIIERDRYGGRGVLVWGGIMLGSRTDLHIFDAGSDNGTRYCNEILLPYVRLFRGAMGLQFFFMDDNAPCHRTVAAEQLLETLVLRVTCASLSWTTGWWVPTRPPSSSLPSAPDHRPARLESARSILIFTIILRYRSVESDLRVSLMNNGLVGPYSATVLVTLPSAPDHRPPRLASARSIPLLR